MPKIKFKNIPIHAMDRICEFYSYCASCGDCPLHNGKTKCYDEPLTDPDSIMELSEQEFPTNREWMESLSNEDLADFMTAGLLIRGGKYNGFKVTVSLITDKEDLLDWLSQPCVYLMEEKQNDSNDIGWAR